MEAWPHGLLEVPEEPLAIVGRGAGPEAPHVAAPELVVDLNTAPAEIFSALPGIGPKLAARIVEVRRDDRAAFLEKFRRNALLGSAAGMQHGGAAAMRR